jgi:uncharacterized cupin superfamily protein
MSMKVRILNTEEVPVDKRSHGEAFECEVAWVAHAIGSQKLGFNITVIPPGKRAFPYHAHHANEEMFYVLAGEGSIRIAGKSHRIKKGDFISLPPGAESAHQIVNDSPKPLRYLAVSTMEVPEVVEYPESGKMGIFTGAHAGHKAPKGALREFVRMQKVDYWDGE